VSDAIECQRRGKLAVRSDTKDRRQPPRSNPRILPRLLKLVKLVVEAVDANPGELAQNRARGATSRAGLQKLSLNLHGSPCKLRLVSAALQRSRHWRSD
jgi:hypothetical protein